MTLRERIEALRETWNMPDESIDALELLVREYAAEQLREAAAELESPCATTKSIKKRWAGRLRIRADAMTGKGEGEK